MEVLATRFWAQSSLVSHSMGASLAVEVFPSFLKQNYSTRLKAKMSISWVCIPKSRLNILILTDFQMWLKPSKVSL